LSIKKCAHYRPATTPCRVFPILLKDLSVTEKGAYHL
jgi:hypothetical protein